ncbi:hypothetical protein Dda_8765 [Drechslerella dactyloides]|uniref:Uncharacterized protein n=1 Tax=Drechslerella dactyloides TaxID=74499 RepID=A0AAD6IQW7_DREDA|nr:hypothetical protein Dda_8765 [Drechslerella dactyloides]
MSWAGAESKRRWSIWVQAAAAADRSSGVAEDEVAEEGHGRRSPGGNERRAAIVGEMSADRRRSSAKVGTLEAFDGPV